MFLEPTPSRPRPVASVLFGESEATDYGGTLFGLFGWLGEGVRASPQCPGMPAMVEPVSGPRIEYIFVFLGVDFGRENLERPSGGAHSLNLEAVGGEGAAEFLSPSRRRMDPRVGAALTLLLGERQSSGPTSRLGAVCLCTERTRVSRVGPLRSGRADSRDGAARPYPAPLGSQDDFFVG